MISARRATLAHRARSPARSLSPLHSAHLSLPLSVPTAAFILNAGGPHRHKWLAGLVFVCICVCPLEFLFHPVIGDIDECQVGIYKNT